MDSHKGFDELEKHLVRLPDGFCIDHVCTTSKRNIADRFNSHFMNTCDRPNSSKQISQIRMSPINNMGTYNFNSIFITSSFST